MKAVFMIHGKYEGTLPAMPNRLGIWEIEWYGRDTPISIDPYDVIIFAPMAFHDSGEILNRRQRETDLALRNGKQVIFLIHESSLAFDRRRLLLDHYLRPKKITTDGISVPATVVASEFAEYTDRFGHASACFVGEGFDTLVRADGKPSGIVFQVAEGLVYCLPFELEPKEPSNWNIFFSILLRAVSDYSEARKFRLPDWLQTLLLPAEEPLSTRISDLREELSDLSKRQVRIARHKAILAAKGDTLRDAVCDVLDGILKGISYRCVKNDERIEDFWIDDATGEHAVIAEVKGVDGNAKRGHINELDSHRERRGLGAKFPALLVVNTFAKATSLEEKNEEIHPEIVEHALANRVLFARTLDLFQILRLHQQSKLDPAALARILLEDTGWLRVTDDEIEVWK